MTVVAQGAAVYAATSGLLLAPPKQDAPAGHKLWLQHPAMSSDLTPYVVGKLLPGGPPGVPAPQRIRLSRGDGQWQSAESALDAEGAFVIAVELLPRRPNVFRIDATLLDGQKVPVSPGALTIVQGLTISDPPLSRTIGVARSSDTVQVYFERGTPLPARRTITHQTVETVAPSKPGAPGADAEFAIKIPIVQGEYDRAHLCRLVGTLEIRSSQIKASLPAGSQVQVSLELDRGGQLSARALVPALNQVFEQVAHLLVPEASPEVLEASIKTMRDRLAELRTSAFRQGQAKAVAHLGRPEQTLAELERDVAAAKGGDADAGQKARRALLELDAMLDEMEAAKHWPELNEKAARRLSFAGRYIAQWGTPAEQKLFAEVSAAFDQARQSRNISEVQRQLRLCTELGNAAYYRDPSVWEDEFEWVSSNIEKASDQARAQALMQQGQQALAADDKMKLREIVEKLWKLLPSDPELRQKGYDSGVR
jgi:molecular chaperone DnaK